MDDKGKIEIEVVDSDEGATVNFHTNMSISDTNFWLDHVKYLIVSGQVEVAS